MTQTWGLIRLDEIDSVETQTVWHAAALTREYFDHDNVLFIDWPNKPFVSVGYHQDPKEEIDLTYCNQKGYEVYRRACGGGQVFLDGDQIFYHAITDPSNKSLKGNTQDFYRKLLSPVVRTYNDFGVNASYAPINDIVANDKKVSGNGAATLGESRILTGNFILSFPTEEMAQTFRVPDEKFKDKIVQSLQERVGSFESILGFKPDPDNLIPKFLENFSSDLNVKFDESSLPSQTKSKMEELKSKYQTDDWKFAIRQKSQSIRSIKIKGGVFVSSSMVKTAGGLIKGLFVFDDKKIHDAHFSGDITIEPMDGLDLISRNLIGTEVSENILQQKISEKSSNMDIPGVTVEELVSLIKQAYGADPKS